MAGEGTRGGVVIGHTRAGNAIYRDHKPDSASYRPFSPGDHASAALCHEKAASATKDAALSLHHRNLASAHRIYYEKAVARTRKPDVVYDHSRGYKVPSKASTGEASQSLGLTKAASGARARAALRAYLGGGAGGG